LAGKAARRITPSEISPADARGHPTIQFVAGWAAGKDALNLLKLATFEETDEVVTPSSTSRPISLSWLGLASVSRSLMKQELLCHWLEIPEAAQL
ncbi:MAG TPA: hypothetical protein VG845_09345, partial [Dehalococcoidia bacterium]|nr:hypothetical protein [Dehalococcoidia bacterium]